MDIGADAVVILIGFDIASHKSGYFMLNLSTLEFDIGKIDARGELYERIRQIHHKAKAIVTKYPPDIVIIEDTFLDTHRKNGEHGKKRGNVNTLKILEKAHGAIISATPELTDIFYILPKEHKLALTGFGSASKQSTIWSIQKKLGVGEITDDEADAAALVLTYLVKRKQWDVLEALKKKYET